MTKLAMAKVLKDFLRDISSNNIVLIFGTRKRVPFLALLKVALCTFFFTEGILSALILLLDKIPVDNREKL